MLKLILVVFIVLAVCVFALSVRILFHRSHKFTQTSIERNPQMRKLGITCPKHDEIRCYGKYKGSDCASCQLYEQKNRDE